MRGEHPNIPRGSSAAAQHDFSMNQYFLDKGGDASPLRVGIFIESGQCPQFALPIIHDINNSQFAKIACIIDSPVSASAAGKEQPRQKNQSTHFLYWLYQQVFEKRIQKEIDPLTPLAIPAETIQPAPVLVDENAIEEIVALELDVIIGFRETPPADALARLAKQGAWYFQLGESENSAPVDTACAHPPLRPQGTTTIGLLQKTARHKIVTLKHARYQRVEGMSAVELRKAPCFGSTWFVIASLAELHRIGRSVASAQKQPMPCKNSNVPTNRQIIRHQSHRLRKLLSRLPATLRGKLPMIQWQIALRKTSLPLFKEGNEAALRDFRWIDNPAGFFRADPFLFRHDNQLWLFFEEYDLLQNKGRIACGQVDEEGNLSAIRTVLKKPWHLSYPQIFLHQGEIYMVPESVEHQTVDLYRARNFPYDWVLEKQLLDVAVVDATLYYHANYWWMFASPMTVSGHAPVTCLWRAEGLTGEWTLASDYIISNDVTFARNGGPILNVDGERYRVSQDCSEDYGSAIWFNQIKGWQPDEYLEEPVCRISGEQIEGLLGVHSYSREDDWEAIDGKFLTWVSHRKMGA